MIKSKLAFFLLKFLLFKLLLPYHFIHSYFQTYHILYWRLNNIKTITTIFGLLGGFVLGVYLSNHIIGGVLGSLVGGYLGSKIGKTAVKKEAQSLTGKGRNIFKTLFWFFILFLLASAVIIMAGLGK